MSTRVAAIWTSWLSATLMGDDKPYDAAPWFWSNQYDARLQMVGLSRDHDERVVRGNPEDGAFAVFYMREGHVIAVDAVNLPLAFMVGKKLVYLSGTNERVSVLKY